MPRGIYTRRPKARRVNKAQRMLAANARTANFILREQRTAAKALLRIAQLHLNNPDYSPHSILIGLASGLGFTRY